MCDFGLDFFVIYFVILKLKVVTYMCKVFSGSQGKSGNFIHDVHEWKPCVAYAKGRIYLS